MQTINTYEFKDLPKDIQKAIYNKVLNDVVTFELEVLSYELNNNNLTEIDYYNILGCSKHYAENTSWFIPECYYEKNKNYINKQVKDDLKESLFTVDGKFIQYK